ncbi:type 1 glutamine amidotransferase [Marinimicrobium locisalis]|uniref:type 1 glutamine amidotransferase n=1 Tax=Marinimicrobium locisalis TaxID=546022 RepID=UPI00322197EC
MPRIHSFHHVPFEGLGHFEEIFARNDWPVSQTHWYRGDTAPELDDFDALIVMGGPMNIDDHDSYPWLQQEKQTIKATIDAGKTVIGICLGAQLIASALGAAVKPGKHREIGWFDLHRQPGADQSPLAGLLPERFPAFHWHGDTFALPDGALLLASSEACENQIFSLGEKVLGLQCHLETTPRTATALIENCGDELDGSHYVQSAEDMLAEPKRFSDINRLAEALIKGVIAEEAFETHGHDRGSRPVRGYSLGFSMTQSGEEQTL